MQGGREGALIALRRSGVLAIDDDREQLGLLRAACDATIDVPPEKVRLEAVPDGATLAAVVRSVSATILQAIESGTPCAVLVTDFHISINFTGLDLVRGLEDRFKDTPHTESWRRIARVVLSGGVDAEEFSAISQSGLFDLFLAKPYQLGELGEVLINSVLLRGRFD
jgi:hypothetical protein